MVGEKEWETCYHSTPAGYITGCRRAASFPFFGDHSLVPSSALKVRSQSESEGLNKIRFSQINLDTLRPRQQGIVEECDEASDCESDSSSSTSEEPDASSGTAVEQMVEVPCKTQKSVRFADDCGKELYSIRVMTEPSDYPPQINPNVLRKLRGDDYVEESPNQEPTPTWNLLFKQPASEYVRFRETLEKDRVSLENVVLKPDSSKIVGTIKVANIAFEKKVFVRYTTNNWQSYMDRQATFQPSTSKVYDTFTFEIELPRATDKAKRMEFCICYIANGSENWDSNGGENYKLENVDANSPPKKSVPPLFGRQIK
ncbi:putative phosphatase regulatory subunit [Necator americanus]|uniref:Putative phosphatase regulatory subunit n=1 Tax=Necator americanus TaxID=51031 RepID=W2TP57_NECAM|nr:putative phosphatase regulatory subunit [Necator americanus]ETN83474.1 putative phosphatase regulatory subunit [Necator americanus]